MKVLAVTAAENLGPTFSHTGRLCFRPFEMNKWFVMGFCAFLATCAQSLSQLQQILRLLPEDILRKLAQGFVANMLWAIPVSVAILLTLIVGTMYIQARGTFMLLDNIIRGRGAVAEPWKRYRAQANSYFLVQLALLGTGLVALALSAGVGLAIAIPDIQAKTMGGMAILGIIIGLLLLVSFSLVLGILSGLVTNFVVPIMYLNNTSFLPAWREAKINVFRGNALALFVYFLLKIALNFGAGIAGQIAICLTCCIGALPYLNSVLFLPIHVFDRCYGLTFLERCHPDYRVFAEELPHGFPVIPSGDAAYWPTQPPAPPQA